MTSDTRVYVWVWLPGRPDPVVTGVLVPTGAQLAHEQVLAFRYGSSYQDLPEAISLFTPELPLSDSVFDPTRPLKRRTPRALASCLRDCAPDAWGRRVINLQPAGGANRDLSDTTYLLESGSNRIGALDFQASPTRYVPRDEPATLDQLMQLAELVEAGEPVPETLRAAAQHGTSIGGARPKALLLDGGRQLIAKFTSRTDSRPVVQAEAVAMTLARLAGVNVAGVEVVVVNRRPVLIVERFDRTPAGVDDKGEPVWHRRSMISMLTVLGISELGSHHSTYADLAHTIRSGPWIHVPETLRDLYLRLAVNVMCGNNDDHLRNHAAFWDGKNLELTPAFDIAPQIRSTNTSSQALGITSPTERASQLRLVQAVAGHFLLADTEARDIIDHVRSTITTHWNDACDQAVLTRTERTMLMGREFCNPYIEYDEA